ncbi:YMGG-like glycine zipper-containing protein [Nitrosomonas ureae]|uniref:Glycine-zipper containing OmpA-like membrane domain-containing protein n=1 Tax=Nitrosomonas ureae TaxID=44577 RepID=A0A286AGS9_9PROT|nr:YMGG-like glycine zipper-containing protein [Nitrosomonas ureae]SOD21086.1 Glycine-zipper containing OmpA-like membrane domain-containing protein [Nitrosomonas ureae]
MLILRRLSILLVTGLITACVNLPTGPSVMTLPGTGKSFEQFRMDDFECRTYAYEQVGGKTSRQASQASGIESAAIGAGLGAAAGAAIGGGQGAAIGAGTGLLAGGVVGSGTAETSGYMSQRQYDMSYIQCMYAKGHRVPVSGRITGNPPVNSNASPRITNPSENFTPPPPPSGNPPPPPSQ